MKEKALLLAASWISLFLLGAGRGQAANSLHTYAAGSTGNFSTATWTGGVPGNNPGDMCNDTTANSPVASTLTLNVNVTIGSIKVNSGGGHNSTFNSDGIHVLTIDGTGISAGNQPLGNADFGCILQNANAGTLTVNPPISLANTDCDIGQNQAGSTTIGGNITALNPVGLNLYRNGSGTLTINGTIGASGSMIAITNLGFSGNAVTLSKVIGPNASLTQDSSTSTLILSGTANTYTGATTVASGILQLGATNAIPSGSNVLVEGTLNMTGFSETISGLSGGGTINGATSGAPTPTLTVGTNNSDGNFTGSILNSAGTLSLTKNGSGTQILSGPNSYTGMTTVNGGVLEIDGSIAGSVIVNNGGTLGGSGAISGSVTVNSGGKTRPGAGVTHTVAGNLAYNSGAGANFDLSASAASGNDQMMVSGASSVLTCGGVAVGINCGASLDQNTDYPLFILSGGSASIAGSFNATPIWLGVTPADASSYSIVTAGNTVVLHYTPGVISLPSVSNAPASNITGTAATANGQVLSTGGQTPTVIVYYGLTNGGTNPGAWSSSVSLGLKPGAFSAALSNLTGSTNYYFAAAATNSAGVAWGTPSKTFTTQAVTSPSVTNLAATSVLANTASLNGQVLSTGNDTPSIRLYYGTSNGGTNAANWSSNVALGLQSGNFSYVASGLANNTTYYYAAAATNSGGTVWATPVQSFTTLAANPTTTQIQYLSGTDKDHTVPWQFSITGGGRNNNIQTTIPVPSSWQTKGFGNYSYGATPVSASVGQYSTTFSVPQSWAGAKIYLVYEGVQTDTATVLNGQTVGPVHQGGFYEFSYDVTSKVVPGSNANVLNVTVSEYSANDSVNNAEREADYWNFSGIFRPVYLLAKPPSNIERLVVNAQASGQISADVYLNGITSNGSVVARVTDASNVQLGNSFSTPVTAGAASASLTATLPAPQLWSAEFPNLYTLTVQLLDANGAVVHTVTEQIGFRTITFVNNSGYYVNGKKVLLRGVCRHEFWPTDGRATSRALSNLDIGLIKDMNFNAVRMTHYPPGKHFLEECDRQGLYVFDEIGGWNQAYDNTIAAQVVRETVIRDVNHPCIIAWDNGNEGGWNNTVNGTFALWDPQNRHVNHPWATYNNVVDDHYPTWSTFSGRFGSGAAVCLPTEINHGLYDGGGGASLSDYWDMIRTNSNGGGMFLWELMDEGLVRDDLGGAIDVQDLLAPDGILGPYRQKEASYYTYKATYNPAQITAPNPANFTGTLAVENRFSFTNFNQCIFHWQLGWYPDVNDPSSTYNTSTAALTGGFIVAQESGNFAGPNVAPDATGSLVLPGFPANGTNFDALRLTATDPLGNNLYTWTWPLHTPAQIRDRIVGTVSATAPAISATTSATEIIVTNGPRVFRFNKTTGVINSVTVSGQAVSLSNGPRPAAGAAWTVNSITNSFSGANYVILVNDLTSAANGFQWTLRPDGWLKLTYRYTLTGAQNYLGITFDYPSANVTSMSWLGQGPFRVYKNRTLGQETFVHTKAINNTWTGQGPLIAPSTTPFVYPEFAGYHGQLNWATLQTTEQPITVTTPTPNLYFRVLTPPTTDKSNVNPAYPPGQISLLDGISAQGDKFRAPGLSSYGPSSVQNTAAGLYTGEASFFFGPPPPSGADRDGNGLVDAWELQYFGALGQNPAAPAANGFSLALVNSFGLSPANSYLNISRLPQALIPGAVSPVALTYRVPISQLDYFSFTPQITDNLYSNWLGADQYPQYFLINSTSASTENTYTIQPNLTNWPGSASQIFLRLRINKK